MNYPASNDDASAWLANLELGFECRTNKTVLASRKRHGPLAVQRPFYPENKVCHAYILHPPGGIVGGDQLMLKVDMHQNTHALLTAPGANKFYRSAGQQATQQQQFHLNETSSLEWLPQESIFFPAANAHLHTQINANSGARYIGWEVLCLGRPAIDETFEEGRLISKMEVSLDGKKMFIDRLNIKAPIEHSAASLRNYAVSATMLLMPSDQDLTKRLQLICEQTLPSASGAIAAATCMNDLTIVRYLGNNTAQAHHLFRQLWTIARPIIMKREAVPPRIWQT